MAKGRSAGHKGDVVALLGQSHLQINAEGDRDEFTQEEVADRIKKSSGANSDRGSNDGGGNYTTHSRPTTSPKAGSPPAMRCVCGQRAAYYLPAAYQL